MGREAATKALMDAGITYDKVQQVNAQSVKSSSPSGSPIYPLHPHITQHMTRANSLSVTTYPVP